MPDQWKKAIVIMIPKPMKNHKDVSNYRPISLLNCFSKLLERVINERIQNWLISTHFLSDEQCGFRHHRQTKDHILRLLQDGQSAFNKKTKMGAIFIDIEKAFDKVWHDGLLYKLDQANIPNYIGKWIKSYLENRQFQVRSSGATSSPKKIETGIPQGSVLGPILFIIYFNDITTCNQNIKELNQALLADDVCAWTSSKQPRIIQYKLQSYLNNVQSWMSDWRMKVSINKTTYQVFNKGCRQANSITLRYNNKKITSTKNPKFLGITLDPGLRLHDYAEEIAIRARRRINMLRRIKGSNWGASSKLIFTTYKVLVRPLIDYVPFATLTMADTNKLKIERLQRSAIRTAIRWPMHTSAQTIYENIKSFKIEPTIDRAFELTNKYIKKAYTNNPLIKETINNYKKAIPKNDGIHNKEPTRMTILGIIRTKTDLDCNSTIFPN